jgi:hypothetical protein
VGRQCDSLNIEKAQEIRSSSNWTEICTELDVWIKAEEARLRNCSPEDLGKIQATIVLLEKVKNLPSVVIERDS